MDFRTFQPHYLEFCKHIALSIKKIFKYKKEIQVLTSEKPSEHLSSSISYKVPLLNKNTQTLKIPKNVNKSTQATTTSTKADSTNQLF